MRAARRADARRYGTFAEDKTGFGCCGCDETACANSAHVWGPKQVVYRQVQHTLFAALREADCA